MKTEEPSGYRRLLTRHDIKAKRETTHSLLTSLGFLPIYLEKKDPLLS